MDAKKNERENLEGIASSVVDAALKVHSALGPGLLEDVYEKCLAMELQKRGYKVERQVAVPVEYEGAFFETGYRLDLLIDESFVVEVKAVEKMMPVYLAQILTYLRLGKMKLGLLLNFNVPKMRDGIRRVVNDL
ncbi:GxxExxY protein [Thalassospiraceae bacterium LMO-JJ14]|nr:GxxExxY protein [Thalassospiraceae bacterium LMO-JJ14]